MEIENKNIVLETNLPNQNLINRGKVRDLYDMGDSLLIVSSDRISAYDAVLPTGILGKGEVLTKLSKFWFSLTENIIQNHFITDNVTEAYPSLKEHEEILKGRSMIVKKAKPLAVECIVRGYITGSTNTSLWTHYKKGSRTYCGITFPNDLRKNEKLENPVITPTTKSKEDKPISSSIKLGTPDQVLHTIKSNIM